MNILLSSYCFEPSIGGIETVSRLLAQEFVQRGHRVRVVTETPADADRDCRFEVIRCASPSRVAWEVRWCDVFFHNNISLQTAWPLGFIRRPWVIAHQTWISRLDRSLGWQDHVKRVLLRLATNVAISKAIATDIGTRSVVIPNPYRDDVFCLIPDVARERDLVFLGRLVSDKGVDLLLRALALLNDSNLAPTLTIIGLGPEQPKLERMTLELGLSRQVLFVGPKSGGELAQCLNHHRVMVVPSSWAEPFGIVAVEGIACGCVVIGSKAGGLPDAIGPCGLTFPNRDVLALADTLRLLLTDESLLNRLRADAPAHLAKHTTRSVGAAYLEIFERVTR